MFWIVLNVPNLAWYIQDLLLTIRHCCLQDDSRRELLRVMCTICHTNMTSIVPEGYNTLTATIFDRVKNNHNCLLYMLMNINVVDNILMQRHPVVDILKKICTYNRHHVFFWLGSLSLILIYNLMPNVLYTYNEFNIDFMMDILGIYHFHNNQHMHIMILCGV